MEVENKHMPPHTYLSSQNEFPGTGMVYSILTVSLCWRSSCTVFKELILPPAILWRQRGILWLYLLWSDMNASTTSSFAFVIYPSSRYNKCS